MARLVPQHSRLHHSLAFLLGHPRRCFILLFPSINTWYLAALQGGLHVLLWAFWFILQIGYPPVWQIPPGPRVISGLYQALGVRVSGYYVVSPSEVAPALLVLYTGAMYVSSLPIIIFIRSTNIYEERSLGVQDNNDHDKAPKSEKSYIGVSSPLRQILTSVMLNISDAFSTAVGSRCMVAIHSRLANLYCRAGWTRHASPWLFALQCHFRHRLCVWHHRPQHWRPL